MRSLAAILAAVMSVTTGGPLRCPCQFAALFENQERVSCADAPPPVQAANEKHCCSCNRHHEPEEPSPAQPKRTPASPPCQHAPAIDLAPPLVGGERTAGEYEPGGLNFAADIETSLGLLAFRPDAPLPLPSNLDSAPPDQLKYCHSFRS